jgi:hypothetical protein
MDRKQILSALVSKSISLEEAETLLAVDNRPASKLYVRVSSKGGVSVYGLQRMPVTLYVEQWERLLAFAPEIANFLTAHNGELKRKDRSKSAA